MAVEKFSILMSSGLRLTLSFKQIWALKCFRCVSLISVCIITNQCIPLLPVLMFDAMHGFKL